LLVHQRLLSHSSHATTTTTTTTSSIDVWAPPNREGRTIFHVAAVNTKNVEAYLREHSLAYDVVSDDVDASLKVSSTIGESRVTSAAVNGQERTVSVPSSSARESAKESKSASSTTTATASRRFATAAVIDEGDHPWYTKYNTFADFETRINALAAANPVMVKVVNLAETQQVRNVINCNHVTSFRVDFVVVLL
jgi:hypothetical protein